MASSMLPRVKRPFQVVVAGDTSVGKTCLVMRYTKNVHTTSHISTIGVDFETKDIIVDDQMYRMHVWDTAGQERFRTIGQSYYRRADCVLIVFDVSSKTSVASIHSWLDEAMKSAPQHAFIAVAGNKCDLDDHRRTVTEEQARAVVATANKTWMRYHANDVPPPPKILYLEVSARTGERINLLFEHIIHTLIEQYRDHPNSYEMHAVPVIEQGTRSSSSSSNCAC